MENLAFELIGQGRREEAHAILVGQEYERQKGIYADGMAGLSAGIRDEVENIIETQKREAYENLAISVVIISFLVVLWSVSFT